MEYDKEDGADGDGSIPEFGAIFMANTHTMKECFRRNVFALPSSKAKFVKQVKPGMVLFLFEYEKRQLFGVFQASSDGAIDIVPHAFHYSGKHFPAQVCFTLIWRCKPLPEKEIRDAIRENYFSPKKFKFGLSEDQVHRLLSLFSSRKLINKLPHHLPRELDDEVANCEDRGVRGDDNFASNERTYMEPSILRDYQGNPLSKATEDDMVYNEDKVYPLAQGFLTDYHDGFLSKRRRVNYVNGFSVNNDSENKIYNDHGMSRSSCIGPTLNSLDEVRRSVDERRVLTVENENQAGKDLNSVNSNQYSVGPLEADYDRAMQRNRLFSEYNSDNGFGRAFADEHGDKPLNKNRHASDDCVHCKYNVLDIVKPVFCGHKNLNLPAQAREITDDHQCLMNMKSKNNRYHVDKQSCPDCIISEQFHDLRHKVSKPNFGTCPMAGFLSENQARQLDCDCRATRDECIPSADGRFRKSDGVENFEDIHTFVNPVVSTEYSSFSKPNQDMSSSVDKCLPERELPWLNIAQDFVPSRDAPYIPELPKVTHRCSISSAVDRDSCLVQENHPFHGSLGKSPYFVEHENKILSTNTSNKHSSLLHETTSSFLDSDLFMHRAPNTSVPPVDYRDSLFSKFSLPYVPSIGRGIIDGEKGLLFSNPSRPSKNYFALGGQEDVASDHVIEHVPCKHKDSTEAKDSTIGVYHPQRELSSYDNQHIKFSNLKEQQGISEAPHSDSNTRRISVFTRLTSAKDVQGGKEINDAHFNFYDHYMDASADEVMEMLPLRKLKKVRVVEQPKHNESVLFDISHIIVENKKLEDAYVAIEEDTYEAPIETRVVDFKRRSEKRKSFISYAAPGNNIVIPHREVESPTKILKRRKLVRPVFGKIESGVEGTRSYQNLQNLEIANSTCGGELLKDIAGLTEPSNNLEEQKDLIDCEGHEVSNEGLQMNSRLEALLKEVTQDKCASLQTSNNVVSKETDATVTSANLEESTTSERLKLGDICEKNPREENNLKMLKKKKKKKRKNQSRRTRKIEGKECSQ
ncbi:hypothetical protein ACJIZ3_013470 [Penstemon smallii]|uniref:DCD domain-containing protein n=1 Tax=Penstemon smallii TaxID=265156 RepID=A0ABD3USW4_9LAMI